MESFDITTASGEKLLKQFKMLCEEYAYRFADKTHYDKRFKVKEEIEEIEKEILKRMEKAEEV